MSEIERGLAIYPGSFDPITRGHEDIVRRALAFVDRVIVAVAHRATHAKQGLFDIEERVEMIREVFADEPRVEVAEFQGLLVDYARTRGAGLIVRGLRAVSDFEYEFQMAAMNARLAKDVETIFLMTDISHSFLSSSMVKELVAHGGKITGLVPPEIEEDVIKYFNR